jgi:hypothetical protein
MTITTIFHTADISSVLASRILLKIIVRLGRNLNDLRAVPSQGVEGNEAVTRSVSK